MEMPVDILKFRLGGIRDNGDIDFDHTAAALEMDEELQEKFLFVPFKELEAIEIEENRGQLNAGSGPEHCAAGENENPNWLYNHGINALALWWRIKQRQEAEAALAAAEKRRKEADERKVAQRPAPGVYTLHTGGELHTAIVTADRRILCPRHRHDAMNDFTDIYDGLENKSRWTFTPIETGLSA